MSTEWPPTAPALTAQRPGKHRTPGDPAAVLGCGSQALSGQVRRPPQPEFSGTCHRTEGDWHAKRQRASRAESLSCPRTVAAGPGLPSSHRRAVLSSAILLTCPQDPSRCRSPLQGWPCSPSFPPHPPALPRHPAQPSRPLPFQAACSPDTSCTVLSHWPLCSFS